MVDTQSWVIEETKSANFGDTRLNKRFGEILNNFAGSPNKSIPGSMKSWGETIAAYRFLNNENVNPNQILSPHKEATLFRIKKEKVVLLPQDTTEIDFTGRKPISGMGYLTSENSHGFYLHPSIAITPERLCLGVVDMQTWVRERLGTREERNKKPIEDKETYCWIKGYETANNIAKKAPETIVVSVADREGDIYELLEKAPNKKNKAYWLVRAKHDRNLMNEAGKALEEKLKEAVKNTNPIGEIEFNLPAGRIHTRGKRSARTERTVKQEVRTCEIYLNPTKKKKQRRSPVKIHVVHCVEINGPENEQLEWFLITSYPVNNAETAIEVVNWYLCRWQIEVFFKVLKSGCKIEELQFETMQGTENCIAMYLIIAWRVLYLTMLGRNCPDLNCDVVFEESEWKSVYSISTKKKPPKTPPKLNEIILIIAKLGGFLGRKSDGYPGATVMWLGIQRMRDFTLAWEIFTRESCV